MWWTRSLLHQYLNRSACFFFLSEDEWVCPLIYTGLERGIIIPCYLAISTLSIICMTPFLVIISGVMILASSIMISLDTATFTFPLLKVKCLSPSTSNEAVRALFLITWCWMTVYRLDWIYSVSCGARDSKTSSVGAVEARDYKCNMYDNRRTFLHTKHCVFITAVTSSCLP